VEKPLFYYNSVSEKFSKTFKKFESTRSSNHFFCLKFVGIDYSLNFPAACIANQSFTEYAWVACINTNLTRKYRKFLEDAMLEFPHLKFFFVEGKQKKTEHYYLTERNKLQNQINVVTTFVSAIKAQLGEEIAAIAIEGLSFGSAGNSLLDLSHATGILKTHLYHSEFSVPESFYVYAPSELKKAIGAKGNAGKIDIFNCFLENPIIETLRESDLFKFVHKYKNEIFDGKTIESPIVDMIDATLGVIKMRQYV
jgi:hypothetical protein